MRENADKLKFVMSRKFEKTLFSLDETTIKLEQVLAKERINLQDAIVTFDNSDPSKTNPTHSET